MPKGFLKTIDIIKMKRDFKNLLASPEASPVIIYYVSSHTGTWDSDRNEYTGGAETWSHLHTKSILKVVSLNDRRLLDLGVVAIGDVIFRIGKSVDIISVLDTNLKKWHVEYKSEKWYPITMDISEHNNLTVPLGDDYVCQSLICTRSPRSVT